MVPKVWTSEPKVKICRPGSKNVDQENRSDDQNNLVKSQWKLRAHNLSSNGTEMIAVMKLQQRKM